MYDCIKNDLTSAIKKKSILNPENKMLYDSMLNYLEYENTIFVREKLHKFLKIFNIAIFMDGNAYDIHFKAEEKKEPVQTISNDSVIHKSIKSELPDLRDEYLVSQAYLADKLGISQSYFSMKERQNSWSDFEKNVIYRELKKIGISDERLYFLTENKIAA